MVVEPLAALGVWQETMARGTLRRTLEGGLVMETYVIMKKAEFLEAFLQFFLLIEGSRIVKGGWWKSVNQVIKVAGYGSVLGSHLCRGDLDSH